jgi:DNA-binding NarL/FixJ family response regulator
MKRSSDTVKILFADDHQIVREGLMRLIERESDLKIIAETDNGTDAVRLALQLRPDVTILDLRMPGLDGASAAVEILKRAPESKIVLLTSFTTAADIKRALNAGALGAVIKDCPCEMLIEAIRSVANGEKFVSQEIANIMEEAKRLPALSPRQKDILRLVAKGFNNDEIASRIGITRHGVKAHLAIVFERIGASSRTEAASIAISAGII